MLIPELLSLLKTLNEKELNPLRHNLFAYGGEIVYPDWEKANQASEIIKECSIVTYTTAKQYANSENIRIEIGTSELVFRPNPPFHLYGKAVKRHCEKCNVKMDSNMTTDGTHCVNCLPD